MNKTMLSVLTGIILFIIPLKAFAHGTAEEHASEGVINYWSYGLVASLLLLAIFLTLFVTAKTKMKYLNLKNKSNRDKQGSLKTRNKVFKWGSIISSLFVIVSLIALNVNGDDKVFTHIHGLGYTSDGGEIYVPAHDGLRVYKDESWAIPAEGNSNDYMGFTMFENGFYSSGHPGPNSDLPNPLGIVRSTDKGKTVETLGLTGVVDFHGMTVGYETEEFYVFNPAQNSQMDQPGFYYSTDQAKTWKQSELAGIEEQAIALAAHPTEAGVVAIGTDQGIFLSKDHGDSFEKLSISGAVSAVSFGHQNNLLVATQTDKVNLFQIDLSTKETVKQSVPDLGEDAISYIKQNPVNQDEFVFATNNRSIYMSNDGGKTWVQSVDKGEAITN